MDSHPHNASPPSGPSSTPSSYPRETGYPTTLTVNNETSCQLGFYLQGTSARTFGVKGGGKSHSVRQGTTSIHLPEGNYKAPIVSRCGSATESLSIEVGSQYEWRYKCVSYRAR